MSNANQLQCLFRAVLLVGCLTWPTSSIGDAAQWPTDGVVFSASVSPAGSSGGASILVSEEMIGAGKVFVVKTWCGNSNSGYASLYTSPGGQGSGQFSLVLPSSCGGGMCCRSFEPGYIVPSGSDLMIYTPSNNLYGNVSGIITDDPSIPAATPTPTVPPPSPTPEATGTPCVGIDCGIFGV